MPRSTVIYTSREGFAELEGLLHASSGTALAPPYTLSFPRKAETGLFRVRVTELDNRAVIPVIEEMAGRGTCTVAAASDREVKAATYEELLEDADRFTRVLTLQFSSPTIVDLNGQHVPFPVVPLLFADYARIWNSFSKVGMSGEMEWVKHVHPVDFKISCATTPFGLGFEGWMRLEMDRGRTEEEIARFNALADFGFYAGTGLHRTRGLGQTRLMPTGPQSLLRKD